MSVRQRPRAVALATLVGIAACATPPDRLEQPKVVVGIEISPYQIQEECLELKSGDRVGYLFRATAPLAFNVHFHDGNAVIEPVTVARTQGEAGEFQADRDQIYCLMWEAGANASVLDYRVERLRR